MIVDFEKSTVGHSGAPSDALLSNGLPAAWAFSTVSNFGSKYNPPVTELTTAHSIEALVEGSDMSRLREGLSNLFDELIDGFHLLTL